MPVRASGSTSSRGVWRDSRAARTFCSLQRTTANAVEPCVSHACAARQVQSSGLLFASVLQALALRGSDDSSGPQLHASEEWRARPVAPKTAGRESSLSAININWPQSHEDRDARRQSTRTPAAAGCSRPSHEDRAKTARGSPQQPPWASATCATPAKYLYYNSRRLLMTGGTRAPIPRESSRTSCSRGTKKSRSQETCRSAS